MSPGRNPLWNTGAKDENGDSIFIPFKDAAAYVTEEFFLAWEVYCTSENLGCLPFAGGWAEQPAWITQAISVLKIERAKADEEERESKQREAEDARKHGK